MPPVSANLASVRDRKWTVTPLACALLAPIVNTRTDIKPLRIVFSRETWPGYPPLACRALASVAAAWEASVPM